MANFVFHSYKLRAFISPVFLNTVKMQLFRFDNQIPFCVKPLPISSVDGSDGFLSRGLLETQIIAPYCVS